MVDKHVKDIILLSYKFSFMLCLTLTPFQACISSISRQSEKICYIISVWACVKVMLFYCESHVNVNFTRLCLQWKIIDTSLVKSRIDKQRISPPQSKYPMSTGIFYFLFLKYSNIIILETRNICRCKCNTRVYNI